MTQEKFCDKSYFLTKKNTPKGALCKYSHSFEERLLNCDALRAFLRPGLESMDFSWTKNSVISRIF